MFRPQKSTRLILVLTLVLLCGCRHQGAPAASNLTISYEVSPLPARVGDVTITIRMKDGGSNEPIAGARIKLEGNMSHAGMAPVFADTKEIGPGQYRTNMKLSMPGDWYVLVHLTLPDGRELEQEFEIKEVAPA